MKIKRLFVVFALVLITANFVSASNCLIMKGSDWKTFAGEEGYDVKNFIVMKTSGNFNAHASIYNQETVNDNEYYLGCQFPRQTSQGNSKIIGLYSAANSHAEVPNAATYTNNVYFPGLNSCRAIPSTVFCDFDEVGVVALSSSTNAHVTSFSGSEFYGTKICCTPTISLDRDANWVDYNRPTNTISSKSVAVGDRIGMLVQDFEPNEEVDFRVYISGSPGDTIYSTSGVTSSSGELKEGWTIRQSDYNLLTSEKSFRFNVTGENGNSAVSGVLSLSRVGGGEIIIVDSCTDYNKYDNAEEVCEDDPKSVGRNAQGIPIGNQTAICKYTLNFYGCTWNSITKKCSENHSTIADINNPSNCEEGIQCPEGYTETVSNSCAEGSDVFTITYTSTNPKCSFTRPLPCTSQVLLPFFGLSSFLASLLFISMIYLIASLRKRKR